MAISPPSPSSSSSMPTSKKYDVFLDFRCAEKSQSDHDFTVGSYLNPLHREIFCLIRGALKLENIKTLCLDENLEGEEISPPKLVRAIEESKLSVFIFSGTYASYTRCLNEFIHILEWQRETSAAPLFYHLNTPDHVWKQEENYAAAFSILEERFKDQMDKVQQWRQSLTKTLYQHRSGFKLVENIIKDIRRSLNKVSSANFDGLVGLDKPVNDVENLLCIGSSNTRIIGIFGIHGIGKTTLAKTVYNRLSSQFEGSYFLDNVREESEKKGLTCLQTKVFAKLFKEETGSVGTPSSGSTFEKERLHSKKVLLVLDDVNSTNKCEILARVQNYFSLGSRIIVTTRDLQVLNDIGVDEMYHVEPLNGLEALQLFHLNAFRNDFPTINDHEELSEWVVKCGKGIPLVLKILGSYLCYGSKSEWRSTMVKLQNAYHHVEILDLLAICYDGLAYEEKNIFLEILCFFKGADKEFVEKTLDSYGYCDANARVDNLIARSLITIDHHGQLWMHDLSQQMGWQIIYQQCIQELGNGSKSWASQVLYDFLRDNKKVSKLKEIYLRNCKRLAKIPAFNKLQNPPYYLNLRSCSNFRRLVTLDLSRTSIRKVPAAINHLSCLVKVDFENCKMLATLPISILKLKSLVYINLSGCSELKNFPIILEPVEHLTDLKLDRTAIKELHCSITNLIGLERLSLKMCENLEFLPSSISCFYYLKELNLCCCQKLKSLPKLPLSMENLNAKGCTSLETVSRPRIEFTQRWDNFFQLHRGRFDFMNCIKLDQKARINIMAEAQSRMFLMATSSSTDGERQHKGMFELWCPGNEIPKWFGLQSAKASIKVELPPNWHSTNFLGFALCAVVKFDDCYIDDKLEFYFQFGLSVDLQPPGIREGYSSFTWRYDPDGGDRIVNSDHVFLFFYHNKSSFSTAASDNVIEATLDFYYDINSGCKVKRCGVHLLYAEDVPEIYDVILQDVGESSEITENRDVGEISDVVTQYVYVSQEEDDDLGKISNVVTQDVRISQEDDDDADTISTVVTHGVRVVEEEEDDNSVGIRELEEDTGNEPESSGSQVVDDGCKWDSDSEESCESESTYSCGCLTFLFLIMDLLKRVFGRLSGSVSEKGPRERLQAPEQVFHNIIMDLREHTRQISEYLQTEINSPRAAEPDYIFYPDQTTLLPSVIPSQSFVPIPEKKLAQSPEEVIQSLCSQIIELRDQNTDILRFLETIMPKKPSRFLDLFSKPSASISSTGNLFQHMEVQPWFEVSEEVIQSLRLQMAELRDCNQQILQFLSKPRRPPPTPPPLPAPVTKSKEQGYQAIGQKGETKGNAFSENSHLSPPSRQPWRLPRRGQIKERIFESLLKSFDESAKSIASSTRTSEKFLKR